MAYLREGHEKLFHSLYLWDIGHTQLCSLYSSFWLKKSISSHVGRVLSCVMHDTGWEFSNAERDICSFIFLTTMSPLIGPQTFLVNQPIRWFNKWWRNVGHELRLWKQRPRFVFCFLVICFKQQYLQWATVGEPPVLVPCCQQLKSH